MPRAQGAGSSKFGGVIVQDVIFESGGVVSLLSYEVPDEHVLAPTYERFGQSVRSFKKR